MKKQKLVLAAFIFVIITTSYISEWAVLASRGVFSPVDFWIYYAEASLIRDGYGNQLYDPGIQSQYQLQLMGVLPLNGHLPFIGPPHLALVLLPFILLSPHWAYYFWIIMQSSLVVLLIFLYIKKNPELSLQERIIHAGAFVSFPMLFVTIYKGQLSLIIFLCIFFWLKEMRKGNDYGTAFWLLVGSIKPQLIVFPFLLTLMARRWKALAYFMAGGALFLSLSAIWLGPGSIRDFVLSMLKMDSNFSPIPYPIYMYNFKGFLSLILGLEKFPLIRSLTLAGFLFSLIAVICLWRGRVHVNDETFDLKMALSLLLGIFFCPYLFFYDTLLIMIVAKLFYDYLLKSFKETAQQLFLLIMYLIPLFFLESSYISIAGYIVRWPAVLMIVWMISLTFIIHSRPNKFYASQHE